jgi:hypothetical protein
VPREAVRGVLGSHGKLVTLLTLILGLWLAGLVSGSAAAQSQERLRGRVVSGNLALPSLQVTLYRSVGRNGKRPLALGSAVSDGRGAFEISYRAPSDPQTVLYLIADRLPAGRGALGLAAVLPPASQPPGRVIVNERTTVAAGFGLAQFFHGRRVSGRAPGPLNAAGMAGNLADVLTGRAAGVLRGPPNGNKTSTLRTLNSLANMVAGCARSGSCAPLLRLAQPPGGDTPRSTLEAVVDIARNPAHNTRRLLALSRSSPDFYRPALRAKQRIAAWFLAVRFVGDGMSMDGPGNFAIDGDGNLWVVNNYQYSRDLTQPVCGSNLVLKFTPTGRYVSGSPYAGGGLSGAGYGITLDPHGNVWVGNFGFAAANPLPDGRPGCPDDMQPPHNSVSEFTAAGAPVSGSAGFTQGSVSWPQGTVSDRQGSIWIANCGNDSVTEYPQGVPDASRSLSNIGVKRPFDIAIDHLGRAFVTGNDSDTVAVLNPDGTVASGSPITGHGIHAPMGIATDSRGNMWVANSGLIDPPCPGYDKTGKSKGGSVTLIRRGGKPARRNPSTRGGLVLPWGIAVDGADNVWVSNFAGTRISEICGVSRKNCPPGRRTGDPLSPRSSGFKFDGLTRSTAVEIDPSGNVWATNNWKKVPIQTNPGGYQVVAFVGIAAPLRTPLIGPPRP